MATNPQQDAFSLPQISKRDLDEGNPDKLNRVLQLIGKQLSITQGSQGPFSFSGHTITFQGNVNMGKNVNAAGLPQFETLQAAQSGGLKTGDLFRTSTGVLMVVS
jgi:hypothetical protein